MKKLIIPTAIAAIAFASCTSTEDEPKPQGELVPIEPTVVSDLMAEANNETRSAINPSSSKIQVAIWESTTANFNDNLLKGNAPKLATATLNGTNTNLVLTNRQFYNAEPTIESHLFAYYPANESEGLTHGSTSNQYNIVTFGTKDGTIDVCASNVVSATKNSASQPTLTLNHKTAWITFNVKTDGTSVTSGTKLKEITLTGAKVPATLTLTKAAATVAAGDPVNLKPAYSNSTGLNLTASAAPATTNNLYICPAGAGTVKINAKTQLGTQETSYTGIDIKNGSNNLAIEAGKHYIITLTFSQKEIKPTVAVTSWTDTNATASVQ